MEAVKVPGLGGVSWCGFVLLGTGPSVVSHRVPEPPRWPLYSRSIRTRKKLLSMHWLCLAAGWSSSPFPNSPPGLSHGWIGELEEQGCQERIVPSGPFQLAPHGSLDGLQPGQVQDYFPNQSGLSHESVSREPLVSVVGHFVALKPWIQTSMLNCADRATMFALVHAIAPGDRLPKGERRRHTGATQTSAIFVVAVKPPLDTPWLPGLATRSIERETGPGLRLCATMSLSPSGWLP